MRAQVAHEGLEPVLIEWEPQTRQRNNRWSDEWPVPLWLLTPEELDRLPEGTVVTSIAAERKVVGVDEIDSDTRFGCVAWGLMDNQLPPRPARV